VLIDGRTVPDGSVLTADLCIVGSGAAGITIARELASSTLDVVLLESGAFEPDTRTQNLNKGRFVGQPVPAALEATRMRYFGGTTNHWAGNCYPLDPADFESKAYIARSGWPFSFEDLYPYYLRAADTCQIGPFRFDWEFGHEHGALAPSELDSHKFRGIARQITEARFGEVYRTTLVDAGNVRVFLWSNVVELLTASDDVQRIDAVQVATLAGPRFQVKATAVVLATGGIEVPRVLLASRSRVPKGLGNGHDLVGRCFADHPNVLVSLALLRSDVPYHTAKTTLLDSAGTPHPVGIAMWLGLRRAALRANELLSAQVSTPDPALVKAVGITKPEWPALFERSVQIEALLGASGAPTTTPRLFLVNMEQEPNLASRVKLSRKSDALGVPTVNVDWHVTRDDRVRIFHTARLFAEQFASAGLGRARVVLGGYEAGSELHTDEKIDDAALDFPIGSNMHHMGTARMHHSPRHGVVDENCRVHEVKNLYIGGSAVFPTYGASPPTMTIVALATRLADHLRTKVLATR
jgi:choline dehydrogenase-like flavoprotein